MIFLIGSGSPMLSREYCSFACPWIWPSLKKQRAICVGYYRRAKSASEATGSSAWRTMSTYRHLGVVVPLVRGDPECGLERTLQIAFLSIHIQEF